MTRWSGLGTTAARIWMQNRQLSRHPEVIQARHLSAGFISLQRAPSPRLQRSPLSVWCRFDSRTPPCVRLHQRWRCFMFVFLLVKPGHARADSEGWYQMDGPDPAGIFSGASEARRCWITQRGHMLPPLMAACHLISALQTTMQRARRRNRFLRPKQTGLK